MGALTSIDFAPYVPWTVLAALAAVGAALIAFGLVRRAGGLPWRPRRVAADDEHQDRALARAAARHVHEAPRHPRGERDRVERLEIDVLDAPARILPARAPRAGESR